VVVVVVVVVVLSAAVVVVVVVVVSAAVVVVVVVVVVVCCGGCCPIQFITDPLLEQVVLPPFARQSVIEWLNGKLPVQFSKHLIRVGLVIDLGRPLEVNQVSLCAQYLQRRLGE